MNRITSFSQNNVFDGCPRQWYYSYIKKIPAISDMCYANAGSAIHKCLQRWYNGEEKSIDTLKQTFNNFWKSYKLDESKIKHKKDLYWLMILNGRDLELEITSTELKIMNSDAVAYLDIVNTKKDKIVDWKSSTRSKENEVEYKKQLTFYSYLYKLKFGRMPKEATVYYLKYNGSKGEYTINPTDKDIQEIEEWHYNIRIQMGKVIEDGRNGKQPPMVENCGFWCPYKNLCNDNEDCLKFTLHNVGNYIQLDGPVTGLLHKGIMKNFSYELKDAYFIKKAKPMAKTTVDFWIPNKRLLPMGFRKRLLEVLERYRLYRKKEMSINVEEHRQFNELQIKMPEKFVNGRELRGYQDEAVIKFKRQKVGVLEIGTGGGKTEIAIEILRQLQMKTLFIVDKIELLRQTKERIEDCLGIEVGQIGGGVDDIKNITVATVQSLTKHVTKYSKYLQGIRFCIFDETHKVAAKSYWKLSNHLTNTEYRLGISGTAFRDDGNDMMIEGVTGNIIYHLSSKKLIDEGWLIRPKIIFIKDYMKPERETEIEQGCLKGLINETPSYTNFYKGFISENIDRNRRITHLAITNNDKKILILTKLVDHGVKLSELIPNSCHLYGGTNKKDRKLMFDSFVKGDTKVLISTISIFSEGIDLPALDMVINAAANVGDIKTIQILGRVLRTLEGKKDAYYYDFIDYNDFFKGASRARKNALYKQGHYIEVLNA